MQEATDANDEYQYLFSIANDLRDNIQKLEQMRGDAAQTWENDMDDRSTDDAVKKLLQENVSELKAVEARLNELLHGGSTYQENFPAGFKLDNYCM